MWFSLLDIKSALASHFPRRPGFDAGHAPSGGQMRQVLRELRTLVEHMASPAVEAAMPVRSVLDAIRACCADRITCSAVVVGMCDSGV